MKTTFTFETADDEERREVLEMMNSHKYKTALQELAERLRGKYKYEANPATTWKEARDLFWEVIKAEGVELE